MLQQEVHLTARVHGFFVSVLCISRKVKAHLVIKVMNTLSARSSSSESGYGSVSSECRFNNDWLRLVVIECFNVMRVIAKCVFVVIKLERQFSCIIIITQFPQVCLW